MHPKHGLWSWARPEAADDLWGRPDADLNVVQLAEPGVGIQFASFHKKSSNGVIRLLFLFKPKLVERLHYGAIQISRPKVRAAVLGDF